VAIGAEVTNEAFSPKGQRLGWLIGANARTRAVAAPGLRRRTPKAPCLLIEWPLMPTAVVEGQFRSKQRPATLHHVVVHAVVACPGGLAGIEIEGGPVAESPPGPLRIPPETLGPRGLVQGRSGQDPRLAARRLGPRPLHEFSSVQVKTRKSQYRRRHLGLQRGPGAARYTAQGPWHSPSTADYAGNADATQPKLRESH